MLVNSTFDSRPGISLSGFSTILPPEIQIIILQLALINDPSEYLTHLGDGEPERLPLESRREQLKDVRTIGRTFCAAVNPAVFASIHISSSRASLRRAENIANSDLAGYVREIVYHEGTFAHRNPDLKLFLSTLASHRRRQDYPAHLKKIKGTELHPNFLTEIEDAKHCEKLDGPTMTNILKKLPNLETYVCLPYHNEWHDPETSAYTLRRVGLSYLPKENPHHSDGGAEFINANWKTKITRLSLSLFPAWLRGAIVSYNYQATSITDDSDNEDENIKANRAIYVSEFRQWTRNLRYLKIGSDHSTKYGLPPAGTNVWSSDSSLFLNACGSLTHLELTYGFALEGWVRNPPIPKGALPRLQVLTISNDTVPAKFLKECLLSLSGSLRHLKLNIVCLQRTLEPWSQKFEDSIVELLYDVTPNMNLQSCTGVNTVRCCKTEKRDIIMAGYKPGKEVMVRQVEEAVCKRRPWPKSLADSSSVESKMKRTAFFSSHWDDMMDLFEENASE